MTDTPIAGWYADPARDDSERWWDGAAWTDHVRALAPAVPFVGSDPAGPPMTRRQLRERVGALVTAEHEVVSAEAIAAESARNSTHAADLPVDAPSPLAGRGSGSHAGVPDDVAAPVADEGAPIPAQEFPVFAPVQAAAPAAPVAARPTLLPFTDLIRLSWITTPTAEPSTGVADQPTDARADAVRPAGVHTRWGWWLAFAPVWGAGLAVAVLIQISSLALEVKLAALGVAALVGLAAMVAMAIADGRALRARGYRSAPAALAVLPLIYFVARVIRTGRRSLGMLGAFVGATALGAALVVAAAYLTGGVGIPFL